ncbi:MAG TPA: methylenetetrahydrofolate--tRNA-(uracil(54)-C(5))-methyltransferase (FADH(2)-oxidizing) TrmFO [Candidatus Avidesulfovibrio excrementigallinarum]|nr:methylenetetrahydrofolate--tRNA-(uracil(54)-C(5))-methyltransferase (FADH(2)-oxidizing) TrmFO [Candidatus Avidesulfovibrio excrementigallinarum]
MQQPRVAIVGGGLAGCECALHLARHGIAVTLMEQKPLRYSPAHVMPKLAELVCSNSLRSDELTSGVGLLKQEMRDLGSAFMAVADAVRVPAGKALAVDREAFADGMERLIAGTPGLTVERCVIEGLDDPRLRLRETEDGEGFDRVVIAAGPLAGDELSASLAAAVGAEHLYFYDAIAPIVAFDSIDMSIAFWGSRYEEPGSGDYLNCPMNEEEYRRFYTALIEADKLAAHAFEKEIHFEGCMPVEALAARGERTLTFGPLKPVGLTDPRTGRRPFAVLQLRPENAARTLFNLVGCQTKMTYPAQDRVFRLIPGLEHADFVRYGSMHRNTYVNAPQALAADLSLRNRPRIHLAGQISGVEGYVESAACGLWAALSVRAALLGLPLQQPPQVTALGALLAHLATPVKNFQPSNAHFGLMPEPDQKIKKRDRKQFYSDRAREAFALWRATLR